MADVELGECVPPSLQRCLGPVLTCSETLVGSVSSPCQIALMRPSARVLALLLPGGAIQLACVRDFIQFMGGKTLVDLDPVLYHVARSRLDHHLGGPRLLAF